MAEKFVYIAESKLVFLSFFFPFLYILFFETLNHFLYLVFRFEFLGFLLTVSQEKVRVQGVWVGGAVKNSRRGMR